MPEAATHSGPACDAPGDRPRLARVDFDAAIFDLDGVITQTARVHATAWKQTFDEFLRGRARGTGGEFRPFDIAHDYPRYVDGLPRDDGVRTFLGSRAIELPEEVVREIGVEKNRRFLELLAHGVDVYPHAVALIARLRAAGFLTAVVTASRNCNVILGATGLAGLFDARIDGNDAAARHLKGKPAPDTFVAAARDLGVEPRRAVVFEDSIAGVSAARAGGFGLVVGVDRVDHGPDLLAAGANLVIDDLAEFAVVRAARDAAPPPLEAHRAAVDALLRTRKPVVFLDYDGTLTPIVALPELATLSERGREIIQRLARNCPVAIVSGRGLADVREHVRVPGIAYAGSHGFELLDASGASTDYPDALEAVPAIDTAERTLSGRLGAIDGVLLERKRFALAVHYRLVDPAFHREIERAVDELLAVTPDLRKGMGKMVFELLPALDWNKGAAVRWILRELRLNDPAMLPVYIGDDVTDEDAFEALAADGLCIAVMDSPIASAAHFRLRDSAAVCDFLENLADTLEDRH